MTLRPVQIAVIGSGQGNVHSARLAEEVGRGIARAKAVLFCGGLGGVMEAAARGARAEGGTVVGLTPGYDRNEANRWVDIVIPTGLGHARNVLVVAAGEAVIALPGGAGTLSEVFVALKLGRPVVVVTRWTEARGVIYAASAHEAVEEALAAAGRAR